MKWNGIVEKMKNGNGMGWEKWVIQTYGKLNLSIYNVTTYKLRTIK